LIGGNELSIPALRSFSSPANLASTLGLGGGIEITWSNRLGCASLVGLERLGHSLGRVVELRVAAQRNRPGLAQLAVECPGDTQHARAVHRALRVTFQFMLLSGLGQRIRQRLPLVQFEGAAQSPVHVKPAAALHEKGGVWAASSPPRSAPSL
jgi:hypothetical protein